MLYKLFKCAQPGPSPWNPKATTGPVEWTTRNKHRMSCDCNFCCKGCKASARAWLASALTVAWPLVPFHLSFSGVYVVEHRMERRGYLMIDMPQNTLNYIGLHCIALLDNTSHRITSHYITLGCIIWHCNTLDSYHAHLYAYIYVCVLYIYICPCACLH